MEKLTELLKMGEYGAYVWPAYAICLGVLALLTYISLRSLRKTQKQLESRHES